MRREQGRIQSDAGAMMSSWDEEKIELQRQKISLEGLLLQVCAAYSMRVQHGVASCSILRVSCDVYRTSHWRGAGAAAAIPSPGCLAGET